MKNDENKLSPFASIEGEKTQPTDMKAKVEEILIEEDPNGYAQGLPDWNILPPNFTVRRGNRRG